MASRTSTMETGTPASRRRWKNSSSEVSTDRSGRGGSALPVLTIWPMAAFQPTLAPPGRLVRLGVMLPRGPGERRGEVARMCDRAGIGAVWVDDSAPAGPPPGSTGPDPLAGLRELASVVTRARLGAMVAGSGPPPVLDALPAGRAEPTLPG